MLAKQTQAPWAMPEAHILATLVNVVTSTMFGVTFVVAGEELDPTRYTRMAAIAIAGPYPLRVALSSDEDSCGKLCSRLFGCAPDKLEPWMIDDALCELVNMAAGQIKSAVSPDMMLTVPKVITPPDLVAPSGAVDPACNIILRADALHLLLTISRN